MKQKINIADGINTSNYKLFLILLALISFFLFANTLSHDYNMDDNLVTQNHRLTSQTEASTVKEIFTSPYYKDDIGYFYGYRPVVLLSFFLENTLFEESPSVSHSINVLLYVLATLLLFNLLNNWFSDKSIHFAFLAVLIFAVHPIHSEVVASIKNRDELLAFIFAILAALSIEKYLKKLNGVHLIMCLFFFSLAMLSKKSVFPLSIVIPISYIFFKKLPIKQFVLISLVVIFPAAIIGADFEISKTILMISCFIGILVPAYYWSFWMENLEDVKLILSSFFNEKRILATSWLIVFVSLIRHEFILEGFGIIILFFLRKKEKIFFIHIAFQLVILGLYLHIATLADSGMLIILSYFIFTLVTKNADWKVTFSAFLQMLLFGFFNGFKKELIFVITLIIVFSFCIFKKPRLGMFFLLLLIGWLILLNDFEAFPTLLIYFATLFFMIKGFLGNKVKTILYGAIVSFALLLIGLQRNGMYLENSSSAKRNVQKSLVISDTLFVSNNFFNANRPISYVENSLIATHTTSETIGTGFMVLGEYLKLMLFPKELSFYYGYSKIKTTDLNNLSVWLSILAHIALLLLAIWQYNKRPIITFGLVWYGLSILLFSNWPEMVAGMVGERLAFTASAGFSIFIAGVIMWIKPSFNFLRPKGVELIVFAMLIVLAGRTFSRNVEWKDPLTLMGNDIKHLEKSAQANNLYATYLMKESVQAQTTPQAKHNYQVKALRHFEKAVSIYPQFFNANYDIGRVCIELRDFQGAKNAFEKAYQIKPENSLVIEELAKTSFDLKQEEDTEFYCNLYLEKNPNNENLHELVAYIMFVNNDKAKAKEYAVRGLNYFPNNNNLQQILIESSK